MTDQEIVLYEKIHKNFNFEPFHIKKQNKIQEIDEKVAEVFKETSLESTIDNKESLKSKSTAEQSTNIDRKNLFTKSTEAIDVVNKPPKYSRADDELKNQTKSSDDLYRGIKVENISEYAEKQGNFKFKYFLKN